MIPKYRVWDSVKKKFVEHFFITDNGLICNMEKPTSEHKLIIPVEKSELILMQSTGLVDKEGTEVFEGDILHHQIQTEYTFIVKYDKDKGRWYGYGLSRTYRIDITKEFLPYYKVIGNIYENPELLEEMEVEE